MMFIKEIVGVPVWWPAMEVKVLMAVFMLVAVMAIVEEGGPKGSNGGGDTKCNSGGDKDSADEKELQELIVIEALIISSVDRTNSSNARRVVELIVDADGSMTLIVY